MSNPITPEDLAKSGSESGHGKALMCWAAKNIEKYPDLKWLTHIPNGGFRDPVTANNLKAEGVKRGVMDYLLLVRRGEYAALWIELKKPAKDDKPAGKPTKDQLEWIEQAKNCGHGAIVCTGWTEARDIIIGYLNYENDK